MRLALSSVGIVAACLLASAAAARIAPQEPGEPGPVLGEGEHAYRWVRGWPRLEAGRELGNTHGGIAFDARGDVYVNTDTEEAVMVFSPAGEHLRSFGAEFKSGLHGMQLVRAGEEELLLVAHTGRHEVACLTLEGELRWRLGWPEASGKYASEGEYRPTSVAQAPDGRLFVADGYGKSWIHRYDAERNYLGSFGGPGAEPGQLATPHGLWVDTRGEAPRLLVADRENHRLQAFDLEGRHLAVLAVELRRPCTVSQRGEELVVADLAGRVTLIDAADRLIAHLGDQPDPALRAQNGVPRERWREGEFLSPHAAAWAPNGDLYVMDWNALGRVTKLERVAR